MIARYALVVINVVCTVMQLSGLHYILVFEYTAPFIDHVNQNKKLRRGDIMDKTLRKTRNKLNDTSIKSGYRQPGITKKNITYCPINSTEKYFFMNVKGKQNGMCSRNKV